MPRAASMTGPRRSLAEIGDPEHLDIPDGGSQGEAHTGGAASRRTQTAQQGLMQGEDHAAETSRPAVVGVVEDDPVHSPPLTPDEIAILNDIASGAEKTYRVSHSEFLEIINGHAKPKARAGRHVP